MKALLLLALLIAQSRELHVGAFYQFSDRYSDNPWLVGNTAVVVEPGVSSRVRRPVIGLIGESTLAIYIEVPQTSDVDAAVAAARARTSLPLLVYIDNGDWTACPSSPTWVGIQAYRKNWETLTQFDVRVRRMLDACRFTRVALVVQTYDTNASLSADVSPQFQYYFAWTVEYRNVVALLAFSDGRSTADCSIGGLRCHPKWTAQWNALAAALLPTTRPLPPTGLRVVENK